MGKSLSLPDLLAIAGRGALPERGRAPYFRTKKLAIIGCTTSHRFAPWADPSWTIAAHASAHSVCQREPDWWFDLHRPECFKQSKNWHKTYYAWLQHQKTPIFMQEAYREIPAAVRFPKERLLTEFRPYFTNHVAWMIALAMTEGITHIGIYGCQYKHETEYGVQRESCVYWMGRFEGAGGTILLPPKENNLLTEPKQLYGYESHDEKGNLIPAYNKVPLVKTPEQTVAKRILAPDEVPVHMNIGEPPAFERWNAYKTVKPEPVAV